MKLRALLAQQFAALCSVGHDTACSASRSKNCMPSTSERPIRPSTGLNCVPFLMVGALSSGKSYLHCSSSRKPALFPSAQGTSTGPHPAGSLHRPSSYRREPALLIQQIQKAHLALHKIQNLLVVHKLDVAPVDALPHILGLCSSTQRMRSKGSMEAAFIAQGCSTQQMRSRGSIEAAYMM
eukprot:1141776-Pelagomonas_calceolata.AAC.1